jgi:hypothetical protein
VEPDVQTAATDGPSGAAGAPKGPRTSPRRKLRVAWGLRLRRVRTLQDRLLSLLGSSVAGRAALVPAMLHRNPNEATSYWLQLVVALGIATLGLVVGSVAVIIGAMLVAPLMGPIIALAMGLATGSPFLVLRSAARISLSMIVVTGGAALITLLLPFHELNDEIVARTSPTVLANGRRLGVRLCGGCWGPRQRGRRSGQCVRHQARPLQGPEASRPARAGARRRAPSRARHTPACEKDDWSGLDRPVHGRGMCCRRSANDRRGTRNEMMPMFQRTSHMLVESGSS